jgi:hypothetical protein
MLHNLQQSLIKLSQIEIWKYPDTTSPETLYRHHRIARTFGWLWIISGGLMTSSIVEIMVSHGWMRVISIIVGITSAVVTLLAIVPGIASGFWISEIDRALIARGLAVPTEQEKAAFKRARKGEARIAYWFAVAVIAASLIHAGIFHK